MKPNEGSKNSGDNGNGMIGNQEAGRQPEQERRDRGLKCILNGPKPLPMVEASMEIGTANATTAILTAIGELPPRLAVVAFQNAQRIIEAARRERGEENIIQPAQPIAPWTQQTIEAGKAVNQNDGRRHWWKR